MKALEVVKTKLGEYDSSGRRKPVPTGEIQRYECDSVILAVGETLDMDLLQASGLKIKEAEHDRRGPVLDGDQPAAFLPAATWSPALRISPTRWATERKPRGISTSG